MEVITTPSAYEFACAVINDSIHLSVNNAKAKCVINKSDGNKRSQGKNIDYSKWDILAKSIQDEDENEKKKESLDNCNFKQFIGGCSSDKTVERQIYEKPTAEKLLAAKRFREEGNKAFLKKDYISSAIQYQKALLHFYYIFPDTEKEEAFFNKEKLASHLNLAYCKIKQKDWIEALTQCRLALQLDPGNVKALYRRGLAYSFLDDFDKAEEAFQSALLKSPRTVEIKEALRKLQIKRNEYTIKEKKISAKIIEGLKAKCDEDVPIGGEIIEPFKENNVGFHENELAEHKQQYPVQDHKENVDLKTICENSNTPCGLFKQCENINRNAEGNANQKHTGDRDNGIEQKQLFEKTPFDKNTFFKLEEKISRKKNNSETAVLTPTEFFYPDSSTPSKKICISSYTNFFNWYQFHLPTRFALTPPSGMAALTLVYVILFPLLLLLIQILIRHFG